MDAQAEGSMVTFELVDKRDLSSSASLGVEGETAIRDVASGAAAGLEFLS